MNENNIISIFLVDDHAIYRTGIRSSLSSAGYFTPKIVGEASSGIEFFAALASGIKPDLILLDIVLPDTTGVEIAKRLKTEHPNIKIIMLSSEVTHELIHELLDIGVDGYLSKLAQTEHIRNAVLSVMNGTPYYGRSVMRVMYDMCVTHQHNIRNQQQQSKNAQYHSSTSKNNHLTSRENEVMNLLCEGFQIKEIAEKLFISPRTVETHKNNILKKLGFSRISELIKYALSEGLL